MNLGKHLRFFPSALLILLLAACSSAPKRASAPQVAPIQEEAVVTPIYSAEKYMQKAREAASPMQQSQWLLAAAQAWQAAHCDKSLKVIKVLEPELLDNMQQTQARLIKAECYQQLQQPEKAIALLPELGLQLGFDQRIYALTASLMAHQRQWVKAANAYSMLPVDVTEKTATILSWLTHLSTDELENARNTNGLLQPWLQLLLVTRQNADNPQQLSKALVSWQQGFPGYAQSIPEQVVRASQTLPYTPRRIAVLLPLSGKLASQGQAIQDGMLSAYMAGPVDEVELVFFDTFLQSIEDIVPQLQSYDFVIGPLLKENLDKLLALLPADKPMLALNTPDNLQPAPQRYFYGLVPEDEARQMARHIADKLLTTPVIIASDSSVTQRMQQAFVDEWQRAHPEAPAPQVFTFSNNKTMRQGVSQLLDVTPSKDRITQVERLLKQELHSFPRNRRDVDAIVVFANATETELLNPIIESSISPFADIVPVYASSRSYSMDISKNSMRDLRNLKFVDMPWMLDKQRWQQLRQTNSQLWPDRRDSQLRLYAMGYDAFGLLPKLMHMSFFNDFKTPGMTGWLSVSEQGIVQRQLYWAQVRQDNVVNLGLD